MTWLFDLIARVFAALAHGWRADVALRDQGATAAVEAARAREEKRAEESVNAEQLARDIAAYGDDALLEGMLRDRFGPGRK